MLIHLYIDEDAMAGPFVNGLRAREIDVLTVFDAKMTGCNDREQLEYASRQKRILYSFNVGDFCRLHSEFLFRGETHAGIIVVYRRRYSMGEQIRRAANLVYTTSPEEMNDNLVFL